MTSFHGKTLFFVGFVPSVKNKYMKYNISSIDKTIPKIVVSTSADLKSATTLQTKSTILSK